MQRPWARSRASRSPRSTRRCGILKCRRASEPLWKLAGGAKSAIPVYTTEGGWLHHSAQQIVDEAVAAKAQGFKGAKFKVGKPSIAEDVNRLTSVRDAVGDEFELMIDANQAFTVSEALRRAYAYAPLSLAWFEEPLPAEDLAGHVEIAAKAIDADCGRRIALSSAHFREYLERDACSIVQVDCARIGGITPWLKVAHLAETFNVAVCPHFLMELHVSLVAAVPNGAWVEYIPQLDAITTSRMTVRDGMALAPESRDSASTGISPRSTASPSRGRRCSNQRRSAHAHASFIDHSPSRRRRCRHRPAAAGRRNEADRRERHGRRLDSTRAQGGDARDRQGCAGQALQPDHRFCEPRHRARRARPSQQPADGQLRPRLCVRPRREIDAIRDAGCDVHGDCARGRPESRSSGDAQLSRHPVDGQLLGDGRPRHRRSFHARAPCSLPQRRRRRRADARIRLRDGHAW